MAHHKRKKHPAARSHCHMCKPWKDGGVSRESENFEAHSSHVSRTTAEHEELAVSDYPRKKAKVSNIKKRTGKSKPKCLHSWTPWGLVHEPGGYLSVYYTTTRFCRNCGKKETIWRWGAGEDLVNTCPVHDWVTETRYHGPSGNKEITYTKCRFCGTAKRKKDAL